MRRRALQIDDLPDLADKAELVPALFADLHRDRLARLVARATEIDAWPASHGSGGNRCAAIAADEFSWPAAAPRHAISTVTSIRLRPAAAAIGSVAGLVMGFMALWRARQRRDRSVDVIGLVPINGLPIGLSSSKISAKSRSVFGRIAEDNFSPNDAHAKLKIVVSRPLTRKCTIG
jgi:hypothetical protein